MWWVAAQVVRLSESAEAGDLRLSTKSNTPIEDVHDVPSLFSRFEPITHVSGWLRSFTSIVL